MNNYLNRFVSLFLLGATASLNAEIRSVPSQFATIQGAINASSDGDTVEVSPGIYFETVNFGQRAIILKSSDGAGQTIIDGGGLGPVISIEKGARNTGVFGFTIQNGFNQYGAGGIQVARSAPTISGNIVQQNRGTGGKGIQLLYAAALVTNNIVRGNREHPGVTGGGGGGGVGVIFSSCFKGACENEINQNVIEYNSAAGFSDGGAVYGFSPGALIITNNVIRYNEAPDTGGAIALNNSYNVLIENNVMVGNFAGFSPASGSGGAIYLGGSNPGSRIFNNTFISNHAAQASTVRLGRLDQFVNNIIVNDANITAVECIRLVGISAANIIRNNMISGSETSAFAPECELSLNTFGNVLSMPVFYPGTYRLTGNSYGIDKGDSNYSTLRRDMLGANRVVDGDSDGIAQIDLGAFEYQGTFSDGFE